MSEYDFVGVDIAKDKFDVCCTINNKENHLIFENNKTGFNLFNQWISKKLKRSWVCMEATGHYSEPLAEFLHHKQIQVSVVNPYRIRHFAKLSMARNKNDKADAKLIKNYVQTMQPKKFSPRSESVKVLRELVQIIDELKKEITALKNQQGAVRTKVATSVYGKVIKTIQKEIEHTEKKLDEWVNNSPDIKQQVELLTSVKGIGKISAYSILAYLPDVNMFENARQLTAFMGLNPRQRESGKYKGKTKMSKLGHAKLRTAFYMPALSAKRFNTALRPFISRLEANGLAPKAIIGAVMRKLAHIIYGILKKQKPFDATLACKA